MLGARRRGLDEMLDVKMASESPSGSADMLGFRLIRRSDMNRVEFSKLMRLTRCSREVPVPLEVWEPCPCVSSPADFCDSASGAWDAGAGPRDGTERFD